jgi:hypothetical protein
MALIKNIILQDNFGDDKQFTNVYLKVDSFMGSKKEIRFEIGFYREKDGKKLNIQQVNFIPTLDGKNFIAQAYDHLKTLPEFAGAIDC